MHDLIILQRILPKAYFIHPNEIKFDKIRSQIYCDRAELQDESIDQFILELHQDEITRFSTEIIEHLINSCVVLNDLRTIFLVHNKGFLTILSDDSILSDYLSPHHHDIIKLHRILSLKPDLVHDKRLKQVIENKDDWLIKPCCFGKGEGIIFGKDVFKKEWKDIIDDCIKDKSFILQEYIKQEKFPLLHEESESMELKIKDYYMVGSLLCFNMLFLGNINICDEL